MDYFLLLVSQHERIRSLAKKLNTASEVGTRSAATAELNSELEFHFYLEEAHVFPVLERYDALRTGIAVSSNHLWEAHATLRSAMDNLKNAVGHPEKFARIVATTLDAIESHFEDEEVHVFPDARRLVSIDELRGIEKQLAAAFEHKKAA